MHTSELMRDLDRRKDRLYSSGCSDNPTPLFSHHRNRAIRAKRPQPIYAGLCAVCAQSSRYAPQTLHLVSP